MKTRIHYLENLYCHLLVVFLLGRIGFLLNNQSVQAITLSEAIGACWRGFVGHDITVAAMLLAVPWLAGLLALQIPGLKLRRWLTPYFVAMGLGVAVIICADAVMFEYWQFKLDTVVLSYAASPEGATNSVPLSYILTRVAIVLCFSLWTIVPCIWLTPATLPIGRESRLWFRNISIIWTFLLLSGCCFMRQGDVYGNPRSLLANHAAVNPVYAFCRSIRWNSDYPSRYNFFSEEDRADFFSGLYPEPASDIQDTLLVSRRPDVLVVFLEGFGSKFVRELGGLPDVAPGMSRLIPQSIFWRNFYSNSFRTDRGTVSFFNGLPGYPDVGLMKMEDSHHNIPSLVRSLAGQGYEADYIYGGAMTNMGKGTYLKNIGFHHLYDNTAFPPEQQSGCWGVPDSIVAQKACQMVSRWQTQDRHFLVFQCLSSHEPWDVPYHRLKDERLNAFAYSDYSVACLVDSLQRLPQWDNLLVIILPDHGFLYEQTYQDPGFFLAPMLWLGGAVRAPRQMDVIMNQSDVAATLLAQMGIPHDEYRWSRNVLSRTYTYPFAYSNYPAGMLYVDSTGTSICDLHADLCVLEQPADDGLRVLRAKTILQTSYDLLPGLLSGNSHTQSSHE